jgi:hypothetical protein
MGRLGSSDHGGEHLTRGLGVKHWAYLLNEYMAEQLGRAVQHGELARAVDLIQAGQPVPGLGEIPPKFVAMVTGYGMPMRVYLAFFGENDCSQYLKIGIAQNVKARMQGHRTSNPLPLVLTMTAEFLRKADARAVESALLRHMAGDRIHGEWVRCMASVPACRAIAESLAEVASEVSGRPVEFSEA